MPSPLKHKGKRREVKAWAVINKSNNLSFRRDNGYSPYIYAEKYEADYIYKTWKRLGWKEYKIVPVTIIYYV